MTIAKTSIAKTSISKTSITKSSRCSSNSCNGSLTTNSSTSTNSISSSSSSRQSYNWKGTHNSSFSLTLLAPIQSKTGIPKTGITKTSITKTSIAKTSITNGSWKSSRDNWSDSNRGSGNSSDRCLATKSTAGTRSIASSGKVRDSSNGKGISSIISKEKSSISISLLTTIEPM